MNLAKTLRRGLSVTVLMMAFLLLTAVCGTESAPTPTPPPSPSPTADLGDLLSRAGEEAGYHDDGQIQDGRRNGIGSQVL